MEEHVRVGQVIRDLRRRHGVTGVELGKKVGLSQSKISRIETGLESNLGFDKLEAMLNILEAPQTIRQQVLGAFGGVRIARPNKYKLKQPWERHVQTFELERKTSLIRVLSISGIPALLQTLSYRRAMLKHWELSPQEMQRILQTTVKRQDLLWESGRRYHFILQETALYSITGNPTIQIGQLDRLERLMDLDNITIGILPLEAGLGPMEVSSFTLYDEYFLARATADASVESYDSKDIAMYIKLFSAFDKRTDYGDSARALVRKAIDYFS